MREYVISFPYSKPNKPLPIWKVLKGSIVLQYFEMEYGHGAPRGFIIRSAKDSPYYIEPITVELTLRKDGKAYGPHYLGYSVDTSKVKLELVPMPGLGEESPIKFISVALHYLGPGNDGDDDDDRFPVQPIPMWPEKKKRDFSGRNPVREHPTSVRRTEKQECVVE